MDKMKLKGGRNKSFVIKSQLIAGIRLIFLGKR